MGDAVRNSTAFEIRSLCFRYQDAEALADVSFDVMAGESVALLGANGSGKSTLLKMLDGLTFPLSGSIRAFGAEISEETLGDEGFSRSFRRRVGFVFQNSDAQLFSPNVWEEIAFGPLHLGLSPEETSARVEEVLHILGLEQVRERAPYNLSGGEKKKVALATVLAIDPEVYLLDEPTAGLDPKTASFLTRLIGELTDRGKTVITSTQDLGLAARVADRAVVLGEDHRLAAQGPAAEILDDRQLLLDANLIHEHSHRHGWLKHEHPHSHTDDHAHLHASDEAESSGADGDRHEQAGTEAG